MQPEVASSGNSLVLELNLGPPIWLIVTLKLPLLVCFFFFFLWMACDSSWNSGLWTKSWSIDSAVASYCYINQPVKLATKHKLVSPISILDHDFTEDSLYMRLAGGCSVGVLVEVSICRNETSVGKSFRRCTHWRCLAWCMLTISAVLSRKRRVYEMNSLLTLNVTLLCPVFILTLRGKKSVYLPHTTNYFCVCVHLQNNLQIIFVSHVACGFSQLIFK